jgi:enoyl-[acyl-carrier-protein] reductase (NADH)
MIRTTLVTALILTAMTGYALADDCQTDVAKLDVALAQEGLATDVKQQAEDLRNNAVQLCGAGNTDEGLAVTAEAKSLLNVE